MELFFDLVFVVAVAQLGETLASEPSATGFLHYGALFVPVWAWVGFTFHADRFDVEDLPYRLALLLAMLVIAAVAISVPRPSRATPARAPSPSARAPDKENTWWAMPSENSSEAWIARIACAGCTGVRAIRVSRRLLNFQGKFAAGSCPPVPLSGAPTSACASCWCWSTCAPTGTSRSRAR